MMEILKVVEERRFFGGRLDCLTGWPEIAS